MIKLLIADDHPLVRNALTQLLRGVGDIDVIAAAATGQEAVTRALEGSPDVVLMDLEMPELNGIEATRALKAAGSSARVVVLTTFSDRENIMGALDAGAVGYLLKDAEPEDIIRGVRSAATGDSPLAPRAAREVITERAQTASDSGLSARETEVLALVSEGLPNKLGPASGNPREDRQGPPDPRVCPNRSHRPHPSGTLGPAAQRRFVGALPL